MCIKITKKCNVYKDYSKQIDQFTIKIAIKIKEMSILLSSLMVRYDENEIGLKMLRDLSPFRQARRVQPSIFAVQQAAW